MSTFGIILARGGSKRLPGKNMRPLCGKPMIEWTILAAQQARLSALVVSSDSPEILDIAQQCDVMTIRRPAELATDTASPYDAIRHAYAEIGLPFDFICLMQPTSPLRTADDIVACVKLAHETDLPCVVSQEEGRAAPNGAVYVGRTPWLLNGGTFDRGPVLRYEMPPERSVDVDTLSDFDRAAALMLAVA